MTGETALLVAEWSRPVWVGGGGARRGAGPGEQVSGPAVHCYTKKKNSSESFRRNSGVVLTDVVVLEPFDSFRLFCCRLRFFVGRFDAAALLQRARLFRPNEDV